MFMPSDLTDTCPTDYDAYFLSVIQPTATARQQQCSSELFSHSEWISAATGDRLNHVKPAQQYFFSLKQLIFF